VTLSQNHAVFKFTKSGTLLTAWETGYSPTGIAVDTDGSVYVAELDDVLEKFSSSGVLIQQWGELAGGPQQFSGLDGVAVDGQGHVYTAETYNCRVQKFSTDGTYITQWGINGHGPGQFYIPVRLATSADGEWVYVDDYGNSRIQVFTNTGSYLGQLGSEGSGPGQFLSPIGIAVDTHGTVFVADTNNSRIQLFGDAATPATRTSWGELKRRYR
jgi:DNA-binding beta-propeller fold protein YncE